MAVKPVVCGRGVTRQGYSTSHDASPQLPLAARDHAWLHRDRVVGRPLLRVQRPRRADAGRAWMDARGAHRSVLARPHCVGARGRGGGPLARSPRAAPTHDRGLDPRRRARARVVTGARSRVVLRDLDPDGSVLVRDAVFAGVRDDHRALPRAAHRGAHRRDVDGRTRIDDLLSDHRVARVTGRVAIGARRAGGDPRRRDDPAARADPPARAGARGASRAQLVARRGVAPSELPLARARVLLLSRSGVA